MREPMIYATLVSQAAGAILITIVLAGFYRRYRRGYLLRWAWSWLTLCVSLACGALAFDLAGLVPATHPSRLAVSTLASIAGYLHPAWLLLGAWELARGRPLGSRARFLPLLLAIVGAVMPLFYLWSEPVGRFVVRVGVRTSVTGLAFMAAGILVLRAGRTLPGLGTRIVGGAFLGYGVLEMDYLLLGLRALGGHPLPAYGTYLGFAELLLQWVMGLGMVVCLLEEERASALRAAEQIQHVAYHDALTGLPNRQLFLDRLGQALAQAQRQRDRLAVLFLDLDRFKIINDSLGHSVGDHLLQEVGGGSRLRSGRRTRWRASAATSSRCCSPASARRRTPPGSPRRSAIW